MKTATVADLRNHFSDISRWLLEGVPVTITKRGHPFATLSPIVPKKTAPPPIDWAARRKRIFPDGPVKGDVLDILAYNRGYTDEI